MDAIWLLFILMVLYAGLFGLVIGSFLNVCIYRIPEGKTVVKGHSMCMSCQNTLKPRDLVPVFSWVFLRGKCRYCGAPVPARYARIEALTSLVYMLIVGAYIYNVFLSQKINFSYLTMGEIVVLLFIAPVLIVTMMIQYDRKMVLRSAPIIIVILGVIRHAFLILQTFNFKGIIISIVWGIGLAYFSVLASTLLAANSHTRSRWKSIVKAEGFRHFFSPNGHMIRMTDALVVALGFALGFSIIAPAVIIYLIARIIISRDEHKRLLISLVCLGVLIGYLLTQFSLYGEVLGFFGL